MSAALDPAAAARALVSARQAGRTLDVLLSSEAGLSLADAYRVQDQVTALRLAGGEQRAGWKLGYTSAVMRAQMGIDAPNFGPLTDAMLLSSGSSAAWVVVGPVIELDDLASLPVALSVDGSVVERGVGAAASGHPASGVVWLAEQLASRRLALELGDLVITGGLTSAHPLEPGHRISASFGDGRWLAEVSRPELRSR